MKRWMLLVVLFVLWPVTVFAQMPPHVPITFCDGSPDTVKAGDTQTISGTLTKPCYLVNGRVRLADGLSLTLDTLIVPPGGVLEPVNSPSKNITLNFDCAPLNAAKDPEQYACGILCLGTCRFEGVQVNPTFIRFKNEPRAGDTVLTVDGTVNWNAGDRVVIPGTNQPVSVPYLGQWETGTLKAVNGSVLTLDQPLQFDHRGARDLDGQIVALPHIGNLTRSVVLRSVNPNGRRFHILANDRANVTFRYVRIEHGGRTTIDPISNWDSNTLQVGANQIGRYCLHAHHLVGPTTPQANGRQFTFEGNAIDGCKKGGIVVHNSHYGLIQDNVLFDTAGAGIVTEDGSETENVFNHNFSVKPWGTGTERGDDRPADQAWHDGVGIWLRGPNNRITNNVVANANAWGQSYMMLGVTQVKIPPAQGQVPSVVTDMTRMPLLEDRDNEYYASPNGVTPWNLGAECCSEVHELPTSTFLRTRLWHVGMTGYYGYGQNRVTIDGWRQTCDLSVLGQVSSRAFYFGDYLARNTLIKNATVQGCKYGAFAPLKAGDTRDIYGNAPGTFRIESSLLGNLFNIFVAFQYGVTGGGANIPPRAVTIAKDVLFRAPPGQPVIKVEMRGELGTNPNPLVSDTVTLETAAGAEQIYYREQAPSFVIPAEVGAPYAGLTNAQAWAKYGKALGGRVAPANAVSRADIIGLVVAGSAPPPPPPPPPPAAIASLADFSALPVCTSVSTTATDLQGRTWTLAPSPVFKTLLNGAWAGSTDPVNRGGRGFAYVRTPTDLYHVGKQGLIYRLVGDNWQSVPGDAMGCRLPPSSSGSTTLQANTFLVDTLGGIWTATCSYFKFASHCPDFEGNTIEEAIILRNGTRFPDPGVRSIPEPNNGPWNLKWCNGQMYVQAYPTPGTYGRWQGLADPISLAAATGNECGGSPPPQGAITLNPSIRYQTMAGWEGGIAGSVADWTPLTAAQIGAMLDLVVTDYGVTRIRISLRAGFEGPGLGYDIVNDNADPNVLNEAGFNWTNLDLQIDRIVIPARQRVLAKGETPTIVMSYVNFDGLPGDMHEQNPAEYAEFIYAAYRHMQTKYGFVPNGLDMLVEPDNIAGWTPTVMGNAIVATANKLAKEGFAVPEFVAPSVVTVATAVQWIDGINAVPGAMARTSAFSYHCYGGQVQIPDIAARAVTHGKYTAMTECVTDSNNYTLLHNDLTVGRNSAWQQGIFGDLFGCAYGQITNFVGGVATYCPISRIIRQYTKFVRPGAVRIGTSDPNAVAFINADGKYVVVVKADGAGSVTVNGLPNGTYGVFYSTSVEFNIQRPDVTGTAVTATIPDAGALTIYGKTAGPPPPPPPPVPVDCVVSAWSAWTAIDATTEQRTRTVVTPASNGGAACPALSETRPIGQPPPPPPQGMTIEYLGKLRDVVAPGRVLTADSANDAMFRISFPAIVTLTRAAVQGDGVWDTDLGSWIVGVSATQTSALLNSPTGPVNTSGTSFVLYASDDPNRNRFVSGAAFTVAAFMGGTSVSGTVTIGTMPPPPPPQPVDCQVSAWSAWTVINATTEQRTRTVTVQASNGGAVCPALSETRPIVIVPPPPIVITQRPNSCRIEWPSPAPTTATGWSVAIRNMVTNANVGVSDNSPDSGGLYRPFVTTLTMNQTYQLALRWTRSGSTTVLSPTTSVTVKCGG